MLAKSRIERTPRNRLEAAGIAAEKQLAHYLNRSFGDTKDVFIFNDLRVIHEDEVAQMDHLVLHPSGLVIIESKSVSSTISVNRQGEFTRTYEGKRQGMPSPIEQAKRQGDLLRKLLQAHREQLLPKLLGLKVLQFNFHTFPVDILVAISDRGIIKHQGKRPAELLKADQIASRVKEIVTYHAKGRGLTGLIRKSLADKKNSMDDAGVFELNADRLATMVNFLLERHVEPPGTHHGAPDTAGSTPPPPTTTTTSSTPPPPPPPHPYDQSHSKKSAPASRLPSNPAEHATGTSKKTHDPGLTGILASRTSPACKHCGKARESLQIQYGRYGYYFKCQACGGATGIDLECPSVPKQRGKIRKSGRDFWFECPQCEHSELFFTNPS